MRRKQLKCDNCGADAKDLVSEMVSTPKGIKSYLRCSVCGNSIERDVIVLIAEIDIKQHPAEIIMPVMSGDVWQDFGVCLELCGFMLKNASEATGKSVDELVKYSTDYLKKASDDYEVGKGS